MPRLRFQPQLLGTTLLHMVPECFDHWLHGQVPMVTLL